MAMIVSHNASAQLALIELNRNNDKLRKSLEKVSSGQKIVTAKDDSSAYSISERMREQIRTLNQDSQNVQNGSALLKIAAGGIENIVDELRNLKELAIKSANDSNGDADRAIIQKEFSQKVANISDIVVSTNYNGKILLDGTYGRLAPPAAVTGDVVADIVLVVDTTGSMSSYITKVANNIKTFADMMTDRGTDWRIGLVRYDDVNSKISDDIGVKKVEFSSGDLFTTDISEVEAELRNLVTTLGDGDDWPESGYEGVMNAVEYDFRDDASKAVFVLTDASVHNKADGKSQYSSSDVINALKAKNISMSGIISPDYSADWRDIIRTTGGKEYNISGDYGASLADLFEVIVSSYLENGIDDYLDFYDPKNPLVIHHGSKANQATKVYIESMYPKMLKARTLFLSSNKLSTEERFVKESDLAHYKALSYDPAKQEDWIDTLKQASKRSLEDISVTTQKNSNIAIRVLDAALEYSLDQATQIGAYLQRFDYTDANLTVMNENVQAAESTIRDADVAKEMTDYTKNNVLMQAAQSMLAQANQNSSAVLSLLQ